MMEKPLNVKWRALDLVFSLSLLPVSLPLVVVPHQYVQTT